KSSGRQLLKDYVKHIIHDLSPREQKILEMRFGLVDGVGHTLEEVGKEFDVTRERIRQIESKALEKIQQHPEIRRLADY
ncbi:sigma-70 family RNA polymerase sigma factor, partial [Candidatus Uhrbacteria bacterium]|nr:sigma-70 family RNA polymerase sigma factor [Candidatus Uhrbacteria bacterium]